MMNNLQTQASGIQGAAQDDTVRKQKQKICAGNTLEAEDTGDN